MESDEQLARRLIEEADACEKNHWEDMTRDERYLAMDARRLARAFLELKHRMDGLEK